nr:hypothetical protein [uncultured Albidiferax sp.]
METVQEIPEILGKTIVAATIRRVENGDTEFVLRLDDGSTLVVGAWQQEGRPVEMVAEIEP